MQGSHRITNATPCFRGVRAAALLSSLLVTLLVSACGGDSASEQQQAAANDATYAWPDGDRPIAVLEIEGYGEVHIALYPELAPKTVENFISLVKDDFYLGTTFHRVIPGFMMQGGDENSKDDDPGNDGQGSPGFRIEDEFNAAPHERGVVSMANLGGRNTGDSQFFILHADARQLDGKHAIFGRVVKGMDVVDKIEKVPTDEHGRWGPSHRPLENVKIVGASVRASGGTGAVRAASPSDTAEADPAESTKAASAGLPNA